MKMSKRLTVLMLACLLSFGMVACGGGSAADTGSSEVIEGVTNAYKLKVYNFTGGYGEEWINTLTSRYKRARAGIEFTVNGKTYDGVDFEITKEKWGDVFCVVRRGYLL